MSPTPSPVRSCAPLAWAGHVKRNHQQCGKCWSSAVGTGYGEASLGGGSYGHCSAVVSIRDWCVLELLGQPGPCRSADAPIGGVARNCDRCAQGTNADGRCQATR